MRTAVLLWAAMFPSMALGADPPPVAEILARVRENLAAFNAAIPDFVANEASVSTAGAGKHESIAESLFVCVKTASSAGESREVLSVNGKRVEKGRKLSGPFLLTGGFAVALETTFAERFERYQEFRLAGSEMRGGRAAYVLEFVTREGQTAMTFTLDGKPYATRDVGKAWVDRETMQVSRFERRYAIPGKYDIALAVDYAPAAIEGVSFWLPKTVESEVTKAKSGAPAGSFRAEYSKYRRFTASSTVSYK